MPEDAKTFDGLLTVHSKITGEIVGRGHPDKCSMSGRSIRVGDLDTKFGECPTCGHNVDVVLVRPSLKTN